MNGGGCGDDDSYGGNGRNNVLSATSSNFMSEIMNGGGCGDDDSYGGNGRNDVLSATSSNFMS
jgi:hypothetical protein